MSEKSRELWQITVIVAVNLLLLIIISAVRADAVCLGCSGEKVAAVQNALKSKGFYSGEISGEFGFETRKALKAYQKNTGLNDSGETDYATVSALGLGARSGECFDVSTEILARYLKINGGASYPEMLAAAQWIIAESGCFSLTQCLLNADENGFRDLLGTEPSSQSYSAALQAIREANKLREFGN